MAFADFQAKQKQNKQRAVLREFFDKYKGQVLCLTDDGTFISLMRGIVKDLSIPKPGLLLTIPEASKAFSYITESFKNDKKPVLFVERVLQSIGDTSFLIRQCKDSFPEAKIIVLTTTADKDRIMLLHEAGADSFILKPISSNELVDKLAVILRPPGTLKLLLDRARTFIVHNVGGEALKISKKVLEIKPDSAAGYVVLGDALRITGDTDKARMAYERACKYSGDYLEPLQRLVDIAKEQDDKPMQLEYLKRLDAVSPLNAQRKVEIGQLHIALGNADAATQLFDNAVSRVFKDAMAQVAAMTEKIAVSLQDTDPVQAEKYLRKCLELKGRDLSVEDLSTFNHLGISLRKQGRWQDAIIEYKKALKIAPNAEGLYYNMGMAFAEGKDYENAIKQMLKALSINEKLPWTSPTLAYNMGRVFSHGFTYDKALQCLEIAIELKPDHAEAHRALEKVKELMQQEATT